MILTPITMLPKVFEVSGEEGSAANICQLTLAALQDVERRCLFVTDSELTQQSQQMLGGWPQQARTAAQVIFKQLAKQNRIITQARETALYDCKAQTCATPCVSNLLREAVRCKPRVAFVVHSCLQALSSIPNLETVDVVTYLSSEMRQRLSTPLPTLAVGEWTVGDFEQNILRPMCFTASRITIIDKMIAKAAAGLEGQWDRYLEALNWIVGSIAAFQTRAECLLEIYTGVDEGLLDRDQLQKLKERVDETFLQLGKRYGKSINLHLCAFSGGHNFPHERYLASDQFAVSIDRGCDLLLKCTDNTGVHVDRKLRDLNISIKRTSDVAKVTMAYSAVPSVDTVLRRYARTDFTQRNKLVTAGLIVPSCKQKEA